MTRDLVIVGGPTASGKSALALAAAERFRGEIVNADAMQIYRGLAILTDQPGAADRARAAHHLFGTLAPGDACSAGRWRDLAIDACESIWAAQHVPIVVGGTGLYLRTLLTGIAPVPPIPDAVRQAARALFDAIGAAEFHARLVARDPGAAKLRASDTQRMLRAWEVLDATGRSLGDWQKKATGAIDARVLKILFLPPRETVRAACDARFERMVAAGALDEVRALLALKLDPSVPAMKALGVPELAAHLSGRISLAEAVRLAQISTRQYVKRQTTWFRHQFLPELTINEQFSESSGNEIFTKIRQFLLTAD